MSIDRERLIAIGTVPQSEERETVLHPMFGSPMLLWLDCKQQNYNQRTIGSVRLVIRERMFAIIAKQTASDSGWTQGLSHRGMQHRSAMHREDATRQSERCEGHVYVYAMVHLHCQSFHAHELITNIQTINSCEKLPKQVIKHWHWQQVCLHGLSRCSIKPK